MAKKEERVITKEDAKSGKIKSVRVNYGKLKTRKKGKWQRLRRRSGRASGFVGSESVLEDSEGRKYKRRSIRTTDQGLHADYHTAKQRQMGNYDDDPGKGSAPRSCGTKFKKNYNKIKGFEEKELTAQGLPKPKKFKKIYK